MSSALPFALKNDFSKEQHRLLALAAVFQAAQIVHIIATTGTSALDKLGKKHIDALLHAALNIRPMKNPCQNSLMFFQSIAHLRIGLHSLERCIESPYTPQPQGKYPIPRLRQGKQTLSYAMALLHLSDKIYRNPQFQNKISASQQNIIRQLAFFNHDYQHRSVLSALAQLYSDTASTVKPRIMVKGSSKSFNNPYEVAYIRAMLFAGLQAAHYWRELGGSSWQMIFTKSKILKEVKYFAQLQHQSTSMN